MQLEKLNLDLTVCQIASVEEADLRQRFYFLARNDQEISLVCETEQTPQHTLSREDGWRAFRIQGVLDFSLIGILAKIAGILAENGISIFAASTYNTDYVMVKRENFDRAMSVLAAAGYRIV